MQIRHLFFVTLVSVLLSSCTEEEQVAPEPDVQRTVSFDDLASDEDTDLFTSEAIDIDSSLDVLMRRVGPHTVAFELTDEVRDESHWRIFNVDDGWFRAQDAQIVEMDVGLLLFTDEDGVHRWYSKHIDVSAAPAVDPSEYWFYEAMDGVYVARSRASAKTAFYKIDSDSLVRVADVENPDDAPGLTVRFHGNGDHVSIFDSGPESYTQRTVSLVEGSHFDVEIPAAAVRYDFDDHLVFNDAGEWTKVDFESGEVTAFAPGWPSNLTPFGQAVGTPRISAWLVGFGRNSPADIWLGGDDYLDLDCINDPRVLATDGEIFIECSSRVGITDILVLDRERRELIETLPVATRATRVGPNNTLIAIDQTNNEVVTWRRGEELARTGAFADSIELGSGRGVGSEYGTPRLSGWVRDDGSVVPLPGSRCMRVAASADETKFAYQARGGRLRIQSTEDRSSEFDLDLEECGSVAGNSDLSIGVAGARDRWIRWQEGITTDLDIPRFLRPRVLRIPGRPGITMSGITADPGFVHVVADFETNEWLSIDGLEPGNLMHDAGMWALVTRGPEHGPAIVGRWDHRLETAVQISGRFDSVVLLEKAAVLADTRSGRVPQYRLIRLR